ncbi:MAG: FMN-binding protein [Caulobacter sp.]|nr:FMN-binding protein [Caulobacter sp.]
MTARNLLGLMLIAPAALAVAAPASAKDYLTIAQAQQVLFPGATFAPTAVTLTPDQIKRIRKQSGVRQREDKPRIWRAMKGGNLGWFIIDEVVGKHEFITYAAALSPSGRVIGIEILSYRETHGGEIREAAWRAKFRGKTLADPFKLDRDVPNISGATLSCRNVLDGVKRLLVMQQVALPAL